MADTAATATSETAVVTDDGIRRRDFLDIAAVSAAGIGGLAVVYPLISQMAPSKDVLAASSTEVDVSAIEPGQAIKAVFRKQPLFVRRLTGAEIQAANAVDASSLRDPQTLEERTKEGHEDMLVTMGVCTHLGCVPIHNAGDWGGYFCPCHGSKFDMAGRVFQNVPAPLNLVVPPYQFVDDNNIIIGSEAEAV